MGQNEKVKYWGDNAKLIPRSPSNQVPAQETLTRYAGIPALWVDAIMLKSDGPKGRRAKFRIGNGPSQNDAGSSTACSLTWVWSTIQQLVF